MIRSEKVSGGSRDGRVELATVLEFLRPGDELMVTRLDRLGRDTVTSSTSFTRPSSAAPMSPCSTRMSRPEARWATSF